MPLELSDVVRRLANLGAGYPEIVAMLEKANRQRNLPGQLVVDAVPSANTQYLEAILGKDITGKRDDAVKRASGENTTLTPAVVLRPVRRRRSRARQPRAVPPAAERPGPTTGRCRPWRCRPCRATCHRPQGPTDRPGHHRRQRQKRRHRCDSPCGKKDEAVEKASATTDDDARRAGALVRLVPQGTMMIPDENGAEHRTHARTVAVGYGMTGQGAEFLSKIAFET